MVLDQVADRWSQLLRSAHLPVLDAPTIVPLSESALPFATGALRVAVLRHRPGFGRTIVSRLPAELVRARITGVTVEEGYYLAPAGSSVGRWSVQWRAECLPKLREPVRLALPSDVIGAAFVGNAGFASQRVALIDTGDEAAAVQFRCDDHDFAPEAPRDWLGHGTAVGTVIRLAAPDATVHCYRVFRGSEELAESSMLISAINEATLKVGEYAVVAVPQRATGSAKKGRRESLRRIIQHNAARGVQIPVVVCAAGNERAQPMSYPAVEPGFVVAVALDWSGRDAGYNCRAPADARVFTVGAYGGTKNEPLGLATSPGSKPLTLYGSSYAAALVTSAIVQPAWP